jgi:hypothetical protein
MAAASPAAKQGVCILARKLFGICILARKLFGICILARKLFGICILARKRFGICISARKQFGFSSLPVNSSVFVPQPRICLVFVS